MKRALKILEAKILCLTFFHVRDRQAPQNASLNKIMK